MTTQTAPNRLGGILTTIPVLPPLLHVPLGLPHMRQFKTHKKASPIPRFLNLKRLDSIYSFLEGTKLGVVHYQFKASLLIT